MKAQRYALLGALTFIAMVVFAIVHRALGLDYSHFGRGHDVAVDIGLATIWALGAAMLMIRRSQIGFFVTMIAVLVTGIHGIMFSIASRHGLGVPFMIAAVWLAYAVKHSMPAWDLTGSIGSRGPNKPNPRGMPAHRAA